MPSSESNPVSPDYRDRPYWDDILRRLRASGEYIFSRGMQDPPAFLNAGKASRRLLAAFSTARTVLTLRPAVLRPLRELVLEEGKTLIVPSKCGTYVSKIPRDALFDTAGNRVMPSLAIHPPPPGSVLYTGPVDVVVVACLGFCVNERRLYLHDAERGAYLLEAMRDGLPDGFVLDPLVPVVAIAADCQQVIDWPQHMRSFLEAEMVFTPSRTVRLGQGSITSVS